MRIGFGLSLASAGALPAILSESVFSSFSVGEQSLTGGYVLTRASAGGIIATSTTTAVDCPNNDTARFGQAGAASTRGLLIEPSTANEIQDGRQITTANWTAGVGPPTTTANHLAGPDGQVLADRSQVASAGSSRYHDRGGDAARTFTCWARATSGTSNWVPGVAPTAGAPSGTATTFTSIDTTWRRASIFFATLRYSVPCDGRSAAGGGFPGTSAGTRDVCTDMHQVEAHKFATEYIHTSGGTATRAGERLYRPASGAINAGQARLEAKFIAKCARTDGDGDMYFLTQGTSLVKISTAGVVTGTIGGVSDTSAAVTWSLGDTVEVFIVVGNQVMLVKYRVNGGAVATPAIAGSAHGALSNTTDVDVFCNGTSNQLPCWLQELRWWAPGRSPGWAA